WNSQIRPRAVVRRVAERDDGVQAIVAARQLDDDENALGMFLDARALQRLRGQRRRCAVQHERQPGAHAEAIQPAHEKITPRTRATHTALLNRGPGALFPGRLKKGSRTPFPSPTGIPACSKRDTAALEANFPGSH